MEQKLNKIRETVAAQAANLEGKLNQFQSSMVAWQRQITQVWNVMNSVILVLNKQGLITDELLQEAGRELYANHVKNVEATKEAVAKGKKPEAADIIPTPMERLVGAVNKGVE